MTYKTFEDFYQEWGWPTHDAFVVKVSRVKEEITKSWIFYIAQLKIEKIKIVFIESATQNQISSWVDKSYALSKVLVGK